MIVHVLARRALQLMPRAPGEAMRDPFGVLLGIELGGRVVDPLHPQRVVGVHRSTMRVVEALPHASGIAVVARMAGEEEERLHLGLRHEVGGGDEAVESDPPGLVARDTRVDLGLVIAKQRDVRRQRHLDGRALQPALRARLVTGRRARSGERHHRVAAEVVRSARDLLDEPFELVRGELDAHHLGALEHRVRVQRSQAKAREQRGIGGERCERFVRDGGALLRPAELRVQAREMTRRDRDSEVVRRGATLGDQRHEGAHRLGPRALPDEELRDGVHHPRAHRTVVDDGERIRDRLLGELDATEPHARDREQVQGARPRRSLRLGQRRDAGARAARALRSRPPPSPRGRRRAARAARARCETGLRARRDARGRGAGVRAWCRTPARQQWPPRDRAATTADPPSHHRWRRASLDWPLPRSRERTSLPGPPSRGGYTHFFIARICSTRNAARTPRSSAPSSPFPVSEPSKPMRP